MATTAKGSLSAMSRASFLLAEGGPDWVRTIGLIAVSACLPLVVNPAWYDFYFWPKVQVLYGAAALLTALAVRRDRLRWLDPLRSSSTGIALGAWLGLVAAATALSVDPLVSLAGADYRYEGLLTWLAYAAVLALAASAATTVGRARLLLTAVLSAAVVMAGLGLAQHWGLSPVPRDFERMNWTRAWGTTGSPLALGGYLALLLPLPLSLYARGLPSGSRWTYGAAVVLLYAALIATRTRGAWIGFAVGTAVWALATGRARLRESARPLLLLAAALALVTPLVLLSGPHQAAQISQISQRDSAEYREFLWRTTAPLVGRRPLLGWGPETLAQVYPAYGTPEFLRVFPDARRMRIEVDRPHNDFLQQAVSTGLLGLAAYVWLWGTVFRTGWRVARADPGGAALASGLLAGCAAYFIQLQFAFSYVSVAPVFWSLVGILLGLSRIAGKGGLPCPPPAAHPGATFGRPAPHPASRGAHGV
jgi:O-antigen ligase